MHTNSTQQTLAGFIAAGALILTLAIIMPTAAHARTITDAQIDEQETVVRAEARETVEAYLRLILFGLIQKLEMRVDAQTS